jgi:hypothetical protein
LFFEFLIGDISAPHTTKCNVAPAFMSIEPRQVYRSMQMMNKRGKRNIPEKTGFCDGLENSDFTIKGDLNSEYNMPNR